MIRPARDNDAAGIVDLVSACWSEYPGCVTDVENEAPELLTLASYCAGRGGAAWVAEANRNIAGVACTHPLPDGAWEIAKVYVARTHRGAGLAHTLLDAAETFARTHAAVRLKLWSDTRFDRAHRFYEKRSFVRAGPIRALGDKSNSIEFAYAKPLTGVVVERLDAAAAASAEYPLASVLAACVNGGDAVAFLSPLAPETARAFWRSAASAVARGEKILLGAWCDGVIAGTVQLDLATSQAQPHRAEVAKLLVHPKARRRGIGRALLQRIEAEAAASGRWLLTLDTRAGSAAERLYGGAGWAECGRIPDHALGPDGMPYEAVLFAKRLGTDLPQAVPREKISER